MWERTMNAMIARPQTLIVVVGTGTEVGKTWFATALLTLARTHGRLVAARKPAQSFASDDTSPTDAERLAHATGETSSQVCPRHRWYPLAMAPPMAADALELPQIAAADLLTEIQWPSQVDLGLVETAGGLRSPIAHDADNVQLLQALEPDQVILVSDAGLGTINAIRLCMQAMSGVKVIVYLNHFDANNPLHTRNRRWLAEHDQIETVTSIEECWKRISVKAS
jgi:dethiobiotin synthetase